MKFTNRQLIIAKRRLERYSGEIASGAVGIYRDGRQFIVPTKTGHKLIQIPAAGQAKSTKSSAKSKPVEAKIRILHDMNYDESLFCPLRTNSPIDYCFSSEGGIFPATNYMVIGDPGIGKSTQTLDILAKIQKSGKRVLFISGEMNEIDMHGYVKRYPAFAHIPTLFLADCEDDTQQQIEAALKQGWDLVLIDSFIEVQEAVQAAQRTTRTQTEKWLIQLFCEHNRAANDRKLYTAFLAIQQVTKGGTFVGSNKLKHNTTGMLELRYSSEFSGDRYVKVTKNRRGFLYERLHFSLDGPFEVEYDETRLKRDLEIRQAMQNERAALVDEEARFQALFRIEESQEETEAVEF